MGTWSLVPLRAALVADEQGRLREFSRAAYRKSFVESRSLAELDNVLAAAREVGLEPDEVRDGIERPEIKERLKGNTEEALARGVTRHPHRRDRRRTLLGRRPPRRCRGRRKALAAGSILR